LTESVKNNFLQINNSQTILDACRISERYDFSFYDSLIISAALECECTILYSEDMSNGQVIDKLLKIENPFQ
jgi:predicted nucleic acid-binding protein